MSPCRCESIEPTTCPCSVDDSNCISLTGDGSEGDPFVAVPTIDSSPSNLVFCGASGLATEELFQLNPPRVFVRKTAPQNLPDDPYGAFTQITWNTEGYDVTGWFDYNIDPTRITVLVDGVYTIKFYLRADAKRPTTTGAPTTQWLGQVIVNDTTPIFTRTAELRMWEWHTGEQKGTLKTAGVFTLSSEIEYELAAGDTIGMQISVDLDHGVDPDVTAQVETNVSPVYLSARWVAQPS